MAMDARHSAEHDRLRQHRSGEMNWLWWGPYLSERQWGTVREDTSDTGDAWNSFTHDQARSRAYRWGEDAIGGFSDVEQRICLGVGMWNGNDPIIKERLFGLAGPEGNHGEDVKEEYWYTAGTPTHSFMEMRYAYPHRAYPYVDLVETNAARGYGDPEYKLLDTGIFDDGAYFDVDITYAKHDPDQLVWAIHVTNRGTAPARCVVLPTVWFRNTWRWGYESGPLQATPHKPEVWRTGRMLTAAHPTAGEFVLEADDADAEIWLTENETRVDGAPGLFKDGFHRRLIHGERAAATTEGSGTKAAFVVDVSLAAGEQRRVLLRLARSGDNPCSWDDAEELLARRRTECDEFYTALCGGALTADEAVVLQQAAAGLLWNKQFYYLDIPQWIRGDPIAPRHTRRIRNRDWTHLNTLDIISMPDAWEYPWFAAWDLAFHTIPLAALDAGFAKEQLVLMLREWYMHPNGQLPAYEWNFSDVNPPVHAWAAWHVYQIDAAATGVKDTGFLERVFHKLLINFTWWVNRKDHDGNNVFQGGFLGLDNISMFNRSEELPTGGHIDQSDGTAWMAFYTLEMLKIAIELAQDNSVYEDVATKFFEHFLAIATAMGGAGSAPGLWDDELGFFFDAVHLPDDRKIVLRVRSLVGLIPLLAVECVTADRLEPLRDFMRRMEWFVTHRRGLAGAIVDLDVRLSGMSTLFSLMTPRRLTETLRRMLDPAEFLSDFGIRSLSKAHEEEPYVFNEGGVHASITYEPGLSRSPLFGGNSNWRGPVWMPINFLIIEALREFAEYYGDAAVVEHPSGSGREMTLGEVADEVEDRLCGLFLPDEDGVRPSLRGRQTPWEEPPLFHEYFHGDTGQGLGAAHQTGWTGLVVTMLLRRAERRCAG